MLLSKAVTSAALLMVMFSAISAVPGIIRERHIIHAPIKIKTVHHYKVKKIPIIIRKHLHYYKPKEEIHVKPVLEEPHAFHEEEDGHEGGHHEHGDLHPRGPPKHGNAIEAPEEDYDESERSGEEEDENYDYD